MKKATSECHVCGGTQLIYAFMAIGVGVSHCPTCGQTSIGVIEREQKRPLQGKERIATILNSEDKPHAS